MNINVDHDQGKASGESEFLARSAITNWVQGLIGELSAHACAEEMTILKAQADALGKAAPSRCTLLPDPTKPTIVKDRTTLSELATAVAQAAVLAVDLETSSLNHRKGEIVGIGLALSDTTCYIPTAHRFETDGTLRPGQLPLIDVLAALRLQDKALIAHNAKYETKWLRYHGGINCRFVWDPMIAARLLRSDLPANLKDLAGRELDVPDWGLPKTDLERIQILPVETVAAYCAKDCWYTMTLYRRQQACLV